MTTFDIVIPTAGRASLAGAARAPRRTRRGADRGGRRPPPGRSAERPAGVVRLRSGGRGPAAARNIGWRAASARWVAFSTTTCWSTRSGANACAGTSSTSHPGSPPARVACASRCPPTAGRPTGSATWRDSRMRRWITADLCVRRAALIAVGGFDERFARAYREDSDLALRLMDAGWGWCGSARGRAPRGLRRPVGERGQAGRQRRRRPDGRHPWPRLAGARRSAARALARPPGHHRAGRHRARRPARAPASRHGRVRRGLGRGHGRAGLAADRPRSPRPREIATMAATSAVLPASAAWHHLRGRVRARALRRDQPHPPRPPRGLPPCSSTATARSWSTSPTTQTPSASSRLTARAARSIACAPRACGSRW